MKAAGTSRVRWLLVFWLFVLSGVSFLDRVNISIAGGSIAEAYHLSDVQLGKVFSAMLVGYAIFQTVGGRLADRYGPRRVLGILHGPDGSGSCEYCRRDLRVCCGPISSGRRGSCPLPVRQSILCALDSDQRARPCQWMDL